MNMDLFMLNNIGTFITFGNVSRKFPRMAKMIITNYDLLPQPVIVQAGPNVASFKNYDFKIINYCDIEEFNEYIAKSQLIISHAGVGAIGTALKFWKKPIIIPREKKYGEHINDHQVHFANEFLEEDLYFLVRNELELKKVIKSLKYLERPLTNEIGNINKLAASIRKIIESIVYEKK